MRERLEFRVAMRVRVISDNVDLQHSGTNALNTGPCTRVHDRPHRHARDVTKEVDRAVADDSLLHKRGHAEADQVLFDVLAEDSYRDLC